MFFFLSKGVKGQSEEEKLGPTKQVHDASSPPLCGMSSFMKTEAVFPSKSNEHQGSWEPKSTSDNINSFFHHER